ncbi:hypothetical protein QUC31_007194 [Theobroma cacao]
MSDHESPNPIARAGQLIKALLSTLMMFTATEILVFSILATDSRVARSLLCVMALTLLHVFSMALLAILCFFEFGKPPTGIVSFRDLWGVLVIIALEHHLKIFCVVVASLEILAFLCVIFGTNLVLYLGYLCLATLPICIDVMNFYRKWRALMASN